MRQDVLPDQVMVGFGWARGMLPTMVAEQSFVNGKGHIAAVRSCTGEPDSSMPNKIEHLQIIANGIRFHVAVAGPKEAPPILFLHGFPEGWMSWRAVMEAMGEHRLYAPDLRGYPETESPRSGYDVFTLTDDIRCLIEALGLVQPALVSHDWGGALGWIFAHRYSSLIRKLVVVNCTHPKTLARAVFEVEDFQTFRSAYVLFLTIPWIPELLFTTAGGRRLLEFSCSMLEGQSNTMNAAALKEMISRFKKPHDIRGPINYYRQLVLSEIVPGRRARLEAIYRNPIAVSTTLVWGEKDWVLSGSVAKKSDLDAGCPVVFRTLPGVGHFVELESPELLVAEIRRALEPALSASFLAERNLGDGITR
jgi:epoxide hydrolase 4